MRSVRVFLLAALASLLVLFGCNQPGGGSLSNTQAQAIAQAVMSAFGSDGAPKSIVSQKAIGYTTTTATIPNGESFTYAFTGGYSYNGVTFNSGTATLALTTDSSTYMQIVYTGTFNITYQGTLYTFGWNITFYDPLPTGTPSYSGNFTINGQTFTFIG